MLRALTTAATGLEAQQANLDRVSNDLANVNTDGFKRGRVEFQDLMYETLKEPGQQLGAASTTPTGIQKGLGVRVGSAHKIFEQGSAKITNHPFDVMIEGPGFFQVQTPNNEILYTRNGAFKPNAQGQIVTSAGYAVMPNMTVPANATSININARGEVSATMPEGESQVIGQIQVHRFQNDQGLSAAGGTLFKQTAASGAAQAFVPGDQGTGNLLSGALETSNVNVANSMIEMIQAQRAYEMNTRVMGVADKMLEATTNIVR